MATKPVHPLIKLNAVLSSAFFFSWPLAVFAAPYNWHLDCYVMVLLGSIAAQVLDVLFSDATTVNLKKMKEAKYSMTTVAFYYVINFFTFALPFYLCKGIFDAYVPRPLTLDTHVLAQVMPFGGRGPTWATMAATCLNFAFSQLTLKRFALGCLLTVFSDFLFYLGHRHMHRVTPQLHVLHHCCIRTSTTTNMFFNPIDLVVEFSLPILTIFAVSFFVLQDYWVFAIGCSVAQCWYAAGHDEALALAHSRHHTYCNSNYFVYIPWWRDEPRNIRREDGNREWEGHGDAVKKLLRL